MTLRDKLKFWLALNNYIEKIVHGTSSFLLSDAIANSLQYVKAFGGTEQNGTPTPDTPMDIVSNNGVLKVRHQSGLPLGYTLLDYIESSGTQYIDTGVKASDCYGIYADFTPLGIHGLSGVFGSNTEAQNGTSLWLNGNGSSVVFYIRPNTLVALSPQISTNNILNTRCVFSMFNRVATFTYNNVTSSGTYGIGTTTYDTTIKVCGCSTFYDKHSAKAKYNKFMLYGENNTLVRNFIPAKRNSDNVLGMYDTISGTFFTNSGTGEFIAGSPVNDFKVYTDGTVETIKDSLNNTATAEMLLKVGDYQDEQEILSGAVTRNVGIKVLDGTETGWDKNSTANYFRIAPSSIGAIANVPMLCSHFKYGVLSKVGNFNNGETFINFHLDTSVTTTTAGWKEWLASEYAKGTPVIIIYPLATPTTESAEGQTLQITDGDNVLEITQASLDNLELEAKYNTVP